MARIISSVRLRTWPHSARALEWLAAKGRVVQRTTSQNPASDKWDTSTIMRSRSISARNAAPCSVTPLSVTAAQGHTSSTLPGTLLGWASPLGWFHVSVIIRTPSRYSVRSTAGSSRHTPPSSTVSMAPILPLPGSARMSSGVRTRMRRGNSASSCS